MMKKLSLTIIISLFMTAAHAQVTEPVALTDTIVTPQFFIAVIAGVLLALGFQFILTILSVATGISAIGDVKKSYVHSKNHTSGKHDFKDEDHDNDQQNSNSSTGAMVSTGFGVWSTITVALSLFGATALAINLSLITNPIISITLGLVIWATFFIILFYLESRVVNTLVGGLINTATAGLRASGDAVKNMFTPSKEKQIEHVAENTIDKVRKEFQNNFDSGMLDESIDEFFNKFDQKTPDYEKVKNDIQQIIDGSVEKSNKQQDSGSSSSPGKWMAVQRVLNKAIEQSSGGSEEDKSKKEQLQKLQKEFKEAYGEGDTKEEKAEKIIARFTPAEEEEVQGYVNKIKQLLSQDSSNEMSSEELEKKVKDIIKNPKVEAGKLGSRIEEIDRDSIIAFLNKNTSLSRMQAEQYADKAEKTIRKISLELNGNTTGDADGGIVAKIEAALSGLSGGSGSTSNLDFSQLKKIVQRKMDSHGESLETVKGKLKNMDREKLITLVTGNTNIDRKDIDKVVDQIEGARGEVLSKIDEIEETARGRIKMMERKAVIQAEHTRKTAAIAAWWLVASAIISAGAAIGGSLLSTIS
ncbi:hypothetical protein [Zunongwangia sp. H14]|uniref:hypothetical protein n=1 Tax=Zunongwangia sp. H14 TaxID=3240792 RepID=UPI003565A6D0